MAIVLIIATALAIIVALLQGAGISKIKVEDSEIAKIGSFIHEGAMAYLKRQYKVLAIFVIVLAVILALVPGLGWQVSITFIAGACFSILAGYVGMQAATKANMRTTQGAKSGLGKAFSVAFSGGSVMGLIVVGLGGLGVGLILAIAPENLDLLTGYSLGASSMALFARVGGGIYTKAADVGADLVGKVEAGIPEDDPRNPAVIADNVGDNVGDVAGMGGDLLESYVGCIVSALLLGTVMESKYIILATAAGVLASVIGVLFVKFAKAKDAQKSLNFGTYFTAILFAIAAYVLTIYVGVSVNQFFSVACGIIAGLAIGKLTEIYTSDSFKYVKDIAGSCQTGAATNILTGLSTGMMSTMFPILILAIATVLSFTFSGTLGISLAALGMLATVGMIISVDAYGPVADNAGGIAEMSGQEESVRDITDHLDSVGNTTAAVGKGFSIGSAALTALALFTSYAAKVGLEKIDLMDSKVIAGVMIGGMLPFLFSALTISSVSKAANSMIEEVRRQFHDDPTIMEGTGKPDYSRCVDISTRAAIKEMILPGVIAIVSPLVVGLILGKGALAGLLAGATVTGVLLAIMMSNAGGAWDNAKKFIEGGQFGGKGSEAHKAGVIGDTVGDPLKDTAGPSINILIKLMSMVSLVFAPLFM